MILSCPHCQSAVEKHQRTCLTCHKVMIRVCPGCAEDVSVLAVICKYCGERLPAQSVRHEAVRPSPTPKVYVQAVPKADIEFTSDVKYVRWEDPAARGVFRRWWSTWASSVFSPAAFWRQTPAEGGWLKPLTYSWFQVAQLLALLLPFVVMVGVAHAACPEFSSSDAAWTRSAALGVAYLALFPASFGILGVAMFFKTLLWHVPLWLLGAKGGVQGTWRVVNYNSGVGMLGLFPVAGTLLALILSPIMNYHGFRNVHRMSKGRAMLAAALPYLFVGGVIAALILGGACTAVNACSLRSC